MSAIITIMKVIMCLLLYTVYVESISVPGPSSVRYRPCGLAVVRFDRVNETTWEGEVNDRFYTKKLYDDVTVDITFEDPVEISDIKSSSNCFLNETENKIRYTFEIKAPGPSKFKFKVMLKQYTTDVPIVVKEFAINNDTLCNEAIKASLKLESLSIDNSDNSPICGGRALPNFELTTMKGEARPGDWPWHVAIFRNEYGFYGVYKCGGTIVSRTAVLTTIGCITFKGVKIPAEEINVIAGANYRTDHYMLGRQKLIADDVVLHPNYDASESTADLAVIRVSQFRFTDYVQPVCIWGPVYDKTNLFGFQATMVGFSDGEHGVPPNVLCAADTLVQNDSTCIDFHNGYRPLLNEFTFCAGNGPNSHIHPSFGDGGGGLVVPTMQPDNKISWFLRGVTSTSVHPERGTKRNISYYTVYTDVGPHYGWILKHSGLRFTNNNDMMVLVP